MAEQEVLQLDMIVSGLDDLASLVAAQDKASSSTDRLRDAQGKFVSASGSSGGKTVKQQAQEIYEFADAYEVLGDEMQGVFTSAKQVGAAMDPVTHAMAEVQAATEREAAATAKATANHARLATSGGAASKGIGGLQQQIIAGSYAFQDFTATSGDLGAKLNSVTNNLPTLLSGLGGLGTVVSIGATAAIALYRNWDSVASLWQTRMNVPPVVSDMERLKDEVDKNAAAIDKLREKGSLTAEGIRELSELTATQTRLEAEQAQARETEANRKSHGENANAIDKERSSAVGKSVDELGGYDAVVERFVQARMRRGNESEEDRDSIRLAVQETLNKALKGDEGMTSALTMEASLDKTGLTGMFDLEVARQKADTPQAQKVKAEAERAAKEKRKAEGNPMDEAVAIEKARLKAAAEEVKEDMQSPEYKEHQEFLRRRGELDEFGRTPDTVGFDDASARKVQARANADIKKDKPGKEKLAPLPNQARMQSQAAAQQREALATQIHQDSNGGFNPDQSRQIAGRAMHLAQKNGDLMGSVAMAMAETQAAMAGFAGRMQHLEQQVQGLHGNAKQLNRRAHSRMPTALNSGGPQ